MAKSVCSDRKGICHLSINALIVAFEKLSSLKEPEAKLIDLYSEGGKKNIMNVAFKWTGETAENMLTNTNKFKAGRIALFVYILLWITSPKKVALE